MCWYSKDGELQWEKHVGNQKLRCEAVIVATQCHDKGYAIAAAWAKPRYSGVSPYVFIRVDSTGCDTVEAYCKAMEVGVKKYLPETRMFRVFPNPASSQVNITTDAAEGRIEIREINGRLVKEVTIEKETSAFSVSEFAVGIYLLSLHDEEGKCIARTRLSVQ